MKKVLIVEDEQSILKLLQYNLEKEGYEVSGAMDGKEGYEMALSTSFDIILLDLMLPGMDGMDVCRELRREKVDAPIIMLTAKDSEIDKIVGLELGADDYMTKPFSPREVIARMKAIFRRMERNSASKEESNELTEDIIIGDIVISPDQYEVSVRGEKQEVTPKEFELLLYLARHKGRILNREQLLQAVWDFDFTGETRIVDMHISHLREKIEEDPKKPVYLKTARGFGYKLEAPK
ncbi:response regulator transcription factor [Alkalibacterium pelagium]|uniref:Two-component system, OmpR family, alkaline phosphatase synthesis response regulator PhoP n=1 Tax=Alkalibacterium pelagium TaxID=426702 RepID=A0A1H7I9J6_9LACT|nr:response regulator transcription factor [Alkalibacterium pelagium]GEN50012.1 DNA-binding response regulator [Alkalibacterium pelagium]SEK59221.1 two-component system, OmpR family, alkaline phosphatase synthesis response regulator PhoP [Alkalibacterium pelagium]